MCVHSTWLSECVSLHACVQIVNKIELYVCGHVLCTEREVIFWDSDCILWFCLNFLHDFQLELIVLTFPHLEGNFERCCWLVNIICVLTMETFGGLCKSDFKFCLSFMNCIVNQYWRIICCFNFVPLKKKIVTGHCKWF